MIYLLMKLKIYMIYKLDYYVIGYSTSKIPDNQGTYIPYYYYYVVLCSYGLALVLKDIGSNLSVNFHDSDKRYI